MNNEQITFPMIIKNTYPKPMENMISKRKIFWAVSLKIKNSNKTKIQTRYIRLLL